MASKGQLLERSVVIPARGICLDGIYLRGSGPGLVVASPMTGRGGSMANPVGNELAYAAALVGRAGLRLDYRGVGGSEGEPSPGLAEAVADLWEGASFLLESTEGETVGVAGYESGCWAALGLAHQAEQVDRVVLVCPPPGEEDGMPAFEEVGAPVLIIIPQGEDPKWLAALQARVKQSRNARLEIVSAEGRALRQGLGQLARMIPPFLGADRRV